MSKIWIIIQREYLSRVKKKSFVIMTILGPVLMAALFIVPVYLANVSDQKKTIGILDETGIFYSKFQSNSSVSFVPLFTDYEGAKKQLDDETLNAFLHIPKEVINTPSTIKLISKKDVGISIISQMEATINKEMEAHKLAMSGIDKKVLDDIRVHVKINTLTYEGGKETQSFSEISYILGFVAGFLIYMVIFMFGSQVMRGIIEEKTSRIVEIIVSSVKPIQLMLGKIIGIAFVGLTQFALWIIFTFILIFAVQESNPEVFKYKEPNKTIVQNKGMTQIELQQQAEAFSVANDASNKVLAAMQSINIPLIIGMFLFYFIGGYLLYASMFAAVGSAVDSEADTQQFVLPITAPLILALISLQFVLNNPDGPVAFWLSMIPFTSPIVIMARIPFGLPAWQFALSMGILVISFLLMTWLSAKIYRTGILMYGKKISYRELWKWLKY